MQTNTNITDRYAELSISRQVDINSLINAVASQPDMPLYTIVNEWANKQTELIISECLSTNNP